MLNSMGAVIFLYIKLSDDIAKNEFKEISAPIADQVYLNHLPSGKVVIKCTPAQLRYQIL